MMRGQNDWKHELEDRMLATVVPVAREVNRKWLAANSTCGTLSCA